MSKTSRYLYPHEAQMLGFDIKKNEVGRKNARYQVKESDWETVTLARMQPNPREFVETQIKKGKDGQVISTVEKLQSEPIEVPEGFEIAKVSTSKSTGQQWIQYLPKKSETLEKEFDFDKLLDKHAKKIKKVKIKPLRISSPEMDFDMLTYTDVHIGLDTNKYKNAMYPIRWIKEDIIKIAKRMVKDVLRNKKSNTVVIDDLGDLMDGLFGKTTRGGHDLPQIMTDEEAYDCALLFKDTITDGLAPYYVEIIINNICNDNHGGIYGYFVNKAVKKFQELKYSNVKVNNYRQFLNHYFVGDICFIITHGKEEKNVKYGFKVKPDDKDLKKIDRYCKENGLYQKSKLIIFKKGDSHQCLFDYCSSSDFFYFNYPATSPSSQWVTDNFELGRRGYVLECFEGVQNYNTPIFIPRENAKMSA